MLLPAKTAEQYRLLEIPSDYEEHEAYRHVTGIIAAVEEQDGSIDDIIEALEIKGFVEVNVLLGPVLPM
jgi:hypothetical protein